jgi:hypothetical protein
VLTAILLYIVAGSCFFLFRLYAIWPKRYQGCDAYNILLCAEMLRRQRRLPIRLPEVFILEEKEQWYPPGFLILCALIPEAWLKKNYWLINHLIDLVHVSILFVAAAALDHPWLGAFAVVLYAMLPSLVLEYSNLNTRPLGVLLLSAFLLSGYLGWNHPAWIAAAAIHGVALLYSHKLSSQQLWFTLPFLAIATGKWVWLLWLPGIYFLSFLIWPHGFRRILQGHWAVVSFWHRYWPLLGAHMVRQSPVYGNGKTRTDYYAVDGWPGLIRFAKETLHQNYFVVPVIIVAMVQPASSALGIFLLAWIGSVYVWAFMIYAIRTLRSIGLGGQYIKFAHMPIFLYLIAFGPNFPAWNWAVVLLSVILNVRQYYLVSRNLRNILADQSGRISTELEAILDRLRGEKGARVMCLPVHLCDLVAYLSRVPTYWGTHSHCFDEKLGDFFPVLRRRVEDYAYDDNLTHLLLDVEYVSPKELGLDEEDYLEWKGQYLLFPIHAPVGAAMEVVFARGQTRVNTP